MSAYLEGLTGEYAGQRIPIRDYHLTIGRGTGNQLLLRSPDISRNHALIRYANGAYSIVDQNSRLGTVVNSTPVQISPLRSGDVIQIGGNSFRFIAQAGRAPAPAPARGAPLADAPPKSYTTDAILILILYYIGLWIVGFIFNIIRLSEANQYKQEYRQDPEGIGCLWALLIWHIVVPILGLLAILATGGAILSALGLDMLLNW